MRIIPILFLSLLYPYCVTFQVDISDVEIPEGNYIVLMNGSLNGWSWGYELFETDADGNYSGTFCDFDILLTEQYTITLKSGCGLLGHPLYSRYGLT